MSAPEWSGKLDERVPVGARVKLTGAFLKNTGQRTTAPGERDAWSRVECACSLCEGLRYVAVDEYPIEDLLAARGTARAAAKETLDRLLAGYTDEEKSDPRAYPRHFATANLMPEHPRTPRARYYP